MKQVTVSAPGKLMLLGEHAVVYGRPCIVTTVNKRMKVQAALSDESIFKLAAEDVAINEYAKPLDRIGKDEIPPKASFVEMALRNFYLKYKTISGVCITTSGFSSDFGLGSSASVAACTVKALSCLFDINMSPKEIFDLSYQTILDVQQEGSGFDAAAAIYGGTLYYTFRGEIIEPLTINGLELVIGYSGVKTDTVSMVNLVKEKMKSYKKGVEKIFDNIAALVIEAKEALLMGNWERLGTLMDFNQSYLEDLGVSSPKLNQMISAVRLSGAYGAKLSGAGGGDCIVALVTADMRKSVELAIQGAGGETIDTGINVPGIKTEEQMK